MITPAGNSARTRLDRALFVLWGLFWLLMILIAVEDKRGDAHIQWWEPYLWEGSSCLVGTVWLLLQRRAARSWDEELDNPWSWFRRHFQWLPVVLVSFVVSVYAIRHGVYALAGETYEHRPWLPLFFYESIKVLLYSGLWIGITFGLASFASWRDERARLLALQKHLAESQLAQLKAQLQPHFLFNALNTISSLMQVDVERADRLLTELADLLRATLRAGDQSLTTLREELALLDLYARIMQERFAGRATLEWKIDENALDGAVPTLLLQPLLENAYKHGVERSTEPVKIGISARRVGNEMAVSVRNTGALAASGPEGIGLRNCRERLAVLYGPAAHLSLATDREYVVATLTLPWRRA